MSASMDTMHWQVKCGPSGWRRRATARALAMVAAMATMAMGGAGSAWAGPRDGLPARNLLIEWRTNGQGSSQERQVGVQTGRIIIDSRRGVVGRAGIQAGTLQTESDSDTVQQVMVLNGGRARLFMGRTQAVTTWQWAWAPQGGATGSGGGSFGSYGPSSGSSGQGGQGQRPPVQVYPQTVWIDLGQGLMVTPRWPGGQAPVTVELEAQSREPMQGSAYGGQLDPDGQTRRTEVASTVSVPLGRWTVIARNGGQVQQSQSGTLSTRELDASRSEQLEIRITAP